jgi:NarL family two-component system response regulator LiaR
MEGVRVFVVDDHSMIRHGLASMLRAETGVVWVGEAADGAEAVRLAPPLAPDLVLMDLVMPRLDGVEAIGALRPLLPRTRYVIMANLLETADIRRAMAAGVAAFLLKSASAQDLAAVIRAAMRGRQDQTGELAYALAAGARAAGPGGELTQRERELLALMARGLSNQEICLRLAIAMPTVKFHVTNILAKLQADNRTEAVLVALKHKLVALD